MVLHCVDERVWLGLGQGWGWGHVWERRAQLPSVLSGPGAEGRGDQALFGRVPCNFALRILMVRGPGGHQGRL